MSTTVIEKIGDVKIYGNGLLGGKGDGLVKINECKLLNAHKLRTRVLSTVFFDKYIELNDLLEDLAIMGVKINIFFLTINDKEELAQRLVRDKVPFGKAEESVEQTLKQQEKYAKLFASMRFAVGGFEPSSFPASKLSSLPNPMNPMNPIN